MKKINVNVLTEIAIFAAIGWILDFVQGAYSDILPTFAWGGSIGIAMLPVIIIALRRGFLPALYCGLIMGVLDLADGCYPYAPTWYESFFQLMLDYGIGYAACCVSVLFYNKIREGNKVNLYLVLACLVGMTGKFICHYISGVIYWPNDSYGGPFIYSFLYNASYMIPSFILCSIALIVIFKKNSKILIGEEE